MHNAFLLHAGAFATLPVNCAGCPATVGGTAIAFFRDLCGLSSPMLSLLAIVAIAPAPASAIIRYLVGKGGGALSTGAVRDDQYDFRFLGKLAAGDQIACSQTRSCNEIIRMFKVVGAGAAPLYEIFFLCGSHPLKN